jgi:hypothetical protein
MEQPKKLKEEDRAENARPVPSQAEGDEETIDEALENQTSEQHSSQVKQKK